MEKTKIGDFIEIDFTAYANNAIFDTTLPEKAKELGIDPKKRRIAPLKICLGEHMLLKKLEEQLENKEINKEYEIKLKPEEAFGKRISSLIKTVPLNAFAEMPQVGMLINVNGLIARVISINAGRVLIDMNNPLAGKEIIYKVKINKIIKEPKEKIEILANIFNIKIKKISLNENTMEIEIEKNEKQIIDAFKEKIEKLVGIKYKIKES